MASDRRQIFTFTLGELLTAAKCSQSESEFRALLYSFGHVHFQDRHKLQRQAKAAGSSH